tara:strand:- start:845 stop:1975 length:1131 start_codon:yes stop_codon:yes gene_type:complete
MNKLKVMTILGTRPEIIRLSSVIKKLDKFCEHRLVHTGQNYDYELNEIFFEDLKIRKPDFFLEASGNTSAETIGNVIIKSDEVLRREMPDCLLVLGDTNSCMAVIPAKRLKIPIFHMEAGNRCFDMRVPEEINRRIVDHTADVNLTYSGIAREYLLNEGLKPDLVIKTGTPMFEVLNSHINEIQSSKILEKLKLVQNKYFVVSAHREENIDPPHQFEKLVKVLNTLANKFKLPVIVTTHPRTSAKIKSEKIEFDENIRILKPLGFIDYNKLQISARAVLSDSGTINEESSILNFPALNIRESFERPEAMEEAAVMLTGLDINRILQCLKVVEYQHRGEIRTLGLVSDYSTPHVSEKILRILHSYTDYVQRNIWKEY